MRKVFYMFSKFFPNFIKKLYQRNFLKFFHFTYQQYQYRITSIFSDNVLKFSSQFLLNFFKIFLQFSQNFIKIPRELLRVDYKNLNNFLKNLWNISRKLFWNLFENHQKSILFSNSPIFFFPAVFLRFSPNFSKNF